MIPAFSPLINDRDFSRKGSPNMLLKFEKQENDYYLRVGGITGLTVGWCNGVMAHCLWSDKARIRYNERGREARIKNDGRVYHSQQRRSEYPVRTQTLATLVRDHCGLPWYLTGFCSGFAMTYLKYSIQRRLGIQFSFAENDILLHHSLDYSGLTSTFIITNPNFIGPQEVSHNTITLQRSSQLFGLLSDSCVLFPTAQTFSNGERPWRHCSC